MTTISEFLTKDHKRCDDLFAAAEAMAVSGDRDMATVAFGLFQEAQMHHFAMEEKVMFPLFEARTGMTQGPIAVMRSEHLQMIDLLSQMSQAMALNDINAYLGDADTLIIMMQQHNVKEEQMLYRMADQALAGEHESVVGRMRALA